MESRQLSNPLVWCAISAMNSGDREAWFALFTHEAKLTDDGTEQDFKKWCDSEIFGDGKARLVSVEREENHGLTLYGTVQTAHWGSFKSFFKFHQRENELFSGLDVGQVE